MDKICQREKKADARVRQRLIERRNLKSGAGADHGAKLTPEDIGSWNFAKMKKQQQEPPSDQSLVMIEKVRFIMKSKIGTLQRLRRVFAKLDLDANGVLSKVEFEQLVSAILKKKAIDKRTLGMLWEAAWAQRKHGAKDEIDAPTLGHWLCLE
jgi:hypothetical protein